MTAFYIILAYLGFCLLVTYLGIRWAKVRGPQEETGEPERSYHLRPLTSRREIRLALKAKAYRGRV